MVLQDGSAVIGPPSPSMVTGLPGTSRCSFRIGGYSLPGGVIEAIAEARVQAREVGSSS